MWYKGFSYWMTVTKLLKLACWTQLPDNWRKPDIAKSRDIDFIAGLKYHITSTVGQKSEAKLVITELEVIMNLKETDGHWTGRCNYRS